MKLLIVESPTKAKTLGRFLSDDYEVVATVGHIRDLPKSKLGVDLDNNFEPTWELSKGKKDVIKKIVDGVKKADTVLIATDPDREGEAIADHVWQILNEQKKIKLESKRVGRATFHEITKSAVEEAINQAHEINFDLVNAQYARRVLDRLVGYKLSPVLWKKIRRGLSAGRVQSVAVRLIVEKEKERVAFVPKEFWEIWVGLSLSQVDFLSNNVELWMELVGINDKKIDVGDWNMCDQILGDLAVSNFKIVKIENKESISRPSAPFTTSTLQQTAGQKLGWGAKKTMTTAQALYEKGLITYHRTDATNISAQAIDQVRDLILRKYGENYLPEKPNIYLTKSKMAQEAHEAIRPTNVNMLYDELDLVGAEALLYKLIWQRFVSCQMKNGIYDRMIVKVNAYHEEVKDIYNLAIEGKKRIFDGWMKVLNDVSKDDLLPELSEGMQVWPCEVVSNQFFTEPPARYSEASLIKMLEQLGIGRPSTYASIITTIQDRNYVEKDAGRLKPTKIGEAVTEFLIEQFPNEMDYQFTAKMEDNLDDIAKGEKDWRAFMADFFAPFKEHVERAESANRKAVPVEMIGEKCPDCKDGDLVIRVGKFGQFISCSKFPECKYTGKLEKKMGVACPDCKNGDVIEKKTRKGRVFYGCNLYPNCKWVAWKVPSLEKSG